VGYFYRFVSLQQFNRRIAQIGCVVADAVEAVAVMAAAPTTEQSARYVKSFVVAMSPGDMWVV
tara:strand:+ start:339 stop:527 length:189 start_codon:yes stop_codon:yes gene_type:complete